MLLAFPTGKTETPAPVVALWCAEHRRPAVVVERTSVELGIAPGNTLRLLECTHPDCRWGGGSAA